MVHPMTLESVVPIQLRYQLDQERSRVYAFTPVPRACIAQKPIIIYVFSGRRRKGDFQHHVERHLAAHGLESQILLLDLAISESHDVGNPAFVAQILRWIHAGAGLRQGVASSRIR